MEEPLQSLSTISPTTIPARQRRTQNKMKLRGFWMRSRRTTREGFTATTWRNGRQVLSSGLWKLEPWFDGTGEKLWVNGGPGTGKTTLIATAVDDLETRADQTEGMSVGYFYCEHGNKTVTIADVLLVLLRQHLERDSDPSFVALVETAWRRHKRENTKFSQSELERLLKAIVQRRPKTIYLLDALDEFPDRLQISLVNSLSSLGARLIIASRISEQLEKKFRDKTTFFEARARDVDLDRLLDYRIDHSRRLAAVIGQSDLRKEIAETIRAKCDGMFLHAALQIEALRDCKTIMEVRKALADFPREINQFYLDTIKRNMAHPDDIGIATLSFVWLLASLGPLKICDLQYALAFDPSASSPFDKNRMLPVETLMALFCGLVAVDPVTQHVGLIHATAREFLADYLKPDPMFIRRHDIVASACIARLESQDFHSSKIRSIDDYKRAMADHPLLHYAYSNWSQHTHKSSESLTREHAVHFLAQCETYPIAWSDTIDQLTGIHVAALHGFSEPIRDADRDTLCAHSPGRQLTPLMLASSMGHLDVARAILRFSGNPDLQDCIGWTALMLASHNGHVEVVRLLLDAPGIMVNHGAEDGCTALMIASQHGHANVVRLLLDARGILVNQGKNDGWTALMFASHNGHANVVRVLLDAPGILVNHGKNDGWTALILASHNGHTEVVRVLLDAPGVLVNRAEENGCTALMIASQHGHADVVRLLLDAREISVNDAKNDGWTALMFASHNGHANVFRLLLGAPGLLVNQGKDDAWTALILASHNGHAEVVQLLLGTPEILVNHREGNGCTALMIASQQGHANVVRLLLDARGILVNDANNDGWTALMFASHNGHADVVPLLLDAPGILVNQAKHDGWTALMLASHNGVVAKLLQEFIDKHPPSASRNSLIPPADHSSGHGELNPAGGTVRPLAVHAMDNHRMETTASSSNHKYHPNAIGRFEKLDAFIPQDPDPTIGTHFRALGSREGTPGSTIANFSFPPVGVGSTSDSAEPRPRRRFRDRLRKLLRLSDKKS